MTERLDTLATPNAIPIADDPLWRGLEAMTIAGPNHQRAFTERLARENAWDRAYTARVLEEYRRFLFLAARAGHPVTPSRAVDQAWHLHMIHTRDYWDVLCGEILAFPLHHDPTRGGGDERTKFFDWYDRTLTSYREVFGLEPDPTVWEPATQRFDPRIRERWVDTGRFVVASRGHVLTAAAILAIVAVPTLVVGHSDRSHQQADMGSSWVLLAPALVIGLIVLVAALSRDGSRSGAPVSPRSASEAQTSMSCSRSICPGESARTIAPSPIHSLEPARPRPVPR